MQFTPRRFIPFILSAVLALPALLVAQEPVTITGKVRSDAGLPLGQVEVAIPAMGLGALSKDDGSYVIVVPGARVSGQTATLVARRLGYKSQSAQLTLTAGGVTHDFVLAANPLQLGEVVVTGAGTSTETEKLGNVRNNVSSDLIQKASETNVVQSLAGKAPNVTVLQQSGDPGASSFINIRGISSILGSNQPLFVIDCVPVDNSTFSTSNFNAPDDGGGTITPGGQTEGTVQTNRAADINPNDIESVEILKGPAASAIYGARAAFGVILITTKSTPTPCGRVSGKAPTVYMPTPCPAATRLVCSCTASATSPAPASAGARGGRRSRRGRRYSTTRTTSTAWGTRWITGSPCPAGTTARRSSSRGTTTTSRA